MTNTKYVVKRPSDGIYDYQRRVPDFLIDLVGKKVVRQSLRTRDPELAAAKARNVTASLDKVWAALAAGQDAEDAWDEYRAALRLTHALGLSYRSMRDILADPLEAYKRVMAAKEVINEPAKVAAITGAIERPRAKLSDVWKLYARQKADEFEGYSQNQLRKHKVSRERAIAYAQEVLGNAFLDAITRDDVLHYRDWWLEKIKAEELKADTANRSFTDLRGMLSAIDDALRTEYNKVWSNVSIRATSKTKGGKRVPYNPEFVQNYLLKPGAIDALNREARLIVYAMIETGMRLSEVCNLRPEDIRLKSNIPHVAVQERDDRLQKTDYSIRTIPLVGVSLWAMQRAPNGFPRYHDRADSLSGAINKTLLAHGLRPTTQHTVYSLRHTFQDRILAAKAPDRVQADLMGHEFERPLYGEGASLELKSELLESIKFAWDDKAPLAP